MIVSILVLIFSAIASVPVIVLFIEVVAALKKVQLRSFATVPEIHGSVAIVVPAHDEGENLTPTLQDLLPQLACDDRLIVVADNCSDDTAAVAARLGAEVFERNDLSRVGKGYALAHAITKLSDSHPDFVMFVDADCRVPRNAVKRLKELSAAKMRPVQACFLMNTPEGAAVDHGLAEFFWIIRNWVRPVGLSNLGLPVQLMGTGMMFPWAVIANAPLAHGNIVEDLKLGLDLASTGSAPIFHPLVVLTSQFPSSSKGAETQRARWVHGHLEMIARAAPKYLLQGLMSRDLNLLALTFDLIVPPFSMLVPLVAASCAASVVLCLFHGAVAPLIVSLTNLTLLTLALLIAWITHSRSVLSLREIGRALQLLPRRLLFYVRLYSGRKTSTWIRTDRSREG